MSTNKSWRRSKNCLMVLVALSAVTIIAFANLFIPYRTSAYPIYLKFDDSIIIRNSTPIKIQISNISIAEITVYNSSHVKIRNNDTTCAEKYGLLRGYFFFSDNLRCPILAVEYDILEGVQIATA